LFVQSSITSPEVIAQAKAQHARRPPKVRLVLGIVIDQFRYDYLTRFDDLFGKGGFRRLLDGGAVFTNAHYIYSPTVTAAGHATFMSGSMPSMHGIIGNEWFDRSAGNQVTSVSDGRVRLLGGSEDGGGSATASSPKRLVGSTLGDQLRLHTNGRSKVIGIALKDRSAILPAGKHPNGAYWFNSQVGAFVSSTYYFEDLPVWVNEFRREFPTEKYFGSRWKKLLPESAYTRSVPDDDPFEKSPYGNKFPYTINGGETKPGPKFYSQFAQTPYANEYTAAFVKAAIVNEHLGQDDFPDLLTVSFSANDSVGHTYGPYSQEVEDITLRTDQVLADLFTYIDRRVGLDHTVIVLTADHGAAPVPEQMTEFGLGGRYKSGAITEAIQKALADEFGDEKWIQAYVNGNVYFDYGAIKQRKTVRAEVERAACDAAEKVDGVGECFTRSDILSGRLPLTPLALRVANGFNRERSGDLVIVSKPFYLSGLSGTSHGTPYGYDTHVPVILYGAGVVAGSYPSDCSPSDIAPTISTLLKIEPPSHTVGVGRILAEAINLQGHFLKKRGAPTE
jgi:predicted AlkP superfamily pyrophosphatase or phosphodiesterase